MSVSKVLADLSQKAIDEYLNTLSGRLLRPCDSSLLILFDKLQRISLSYRLLIESDSGYESLPILLRTIYETQLYIKYLLDDRNLFVKRGQAYYYSNYQGVVNQVVTNLHALIYKPACIDVHTSMDISKLFFKRSRIYARYPHNSQWDRFVDFSLFDSICLLLNTFSDQFSQEFINHVEGIAFAIFGVKYSKPSYLIKRLRADGVLINEGSNRIKEVN